MNETEDQIYTEDAGNSAKRRRINPRLMAGAIIGMVAIFVLGVWFLAFRGDGQAGKPVPAPRMSSDEPAAGAPITGQTVTLSPEQRENAGIELVTVGEQLASETAAGVASTGVVEANAYRETPAVSLVGGIVRRVVPELGQPVSRGQTVAVVASNEFAEAQSRYVALATERENARRNFERTQRLVAINQPGRTEVDAATKQLTAAEAALAEASARYARTTRLVTIGAASREEVEQDNTKLRAAEAEREEARKRLERANQLLTLSPEARAANEEALNKLRSAESEAAAVRERLIVYGMPAARVDSLRSASQVSAELSIPAPIAGTVTARGVNPGEVIEANKELTRITDLSSVWVIAQVFEKDLARLRAGSGASVTTDAFPDRVFRGQVTYIDPQLDESTRTGKVRVELGNADRSLRLGMFVRVAFGALGNAEQTAPVIPASAVQSLSGQNVVFLGTNDPNIFEIRPVRVGPESNGLYEVFEGVTVGDRIVTQGSFMLRAEVLKQNPSH